MLNLLDKKARKLFNLETRSFNEELNDLHFHSTEYNELHHYLEPGDRIKWISRPFVNTLLDLLYVREGTDLDRPNLWSADVVILTEIGYLLNLCVT